MAGGTAAVQDDAPEDAGEPPQQQAEPLLDLDVLATADAGSTLPVAFRARPLHGLPASMAALMMGGREGGQVALAPLAMPVLMPTGDATAKAAVALVLEIDGRGLLGPSPPPTPQVEVYAYALNAANEVVGFLAQSFVLDLEQVGEAVFVGGLKFTGHLELPPGDYTLRLLVHEPAGQRFGLAKTEVSVPRQAALLTPLAAEAPEAPWLTVGEAPHGDMGALDLGRALELADLPMPSALPLLRGDEARLDLLLYGAAGAALPAALGVEVVDVEGAAAGELQARVIDRQATGLPAIERVRLGLPLASLESGSYTFRFVTPSLGGAAARSAALPAVVLRGATADNLWTDIQHRLSGETAAPGLDLEQVAQRRRGRQRRIREAVADAYRQALERLADGDRSGALTAWWGSSGRCWRAARRPPRRCSTKRRGWSSTRWRRPRRRPAAAGHPPRPGLRRLSRGARLRALHPRSRDRHRDRRALRRRGAAAGRGAARREPAQRRRRRRCRGRDRHRPHPRLRRPRLLRRLPADGAGAHHRPGAAAPRPGDRPAEPVGA